MATVFQAHGECVGSLLGSALQELAFFWKILEASGGKSVLGFAAILFSYFALLSSLPLLLHSDSKRFTREILTELLCAACVPSQALGFYLTGSVRQARAQDRTSDSRYRVTVTVRLQTLMFLVRRAVVDESKKRIRKGECQRREPGLSREGASLIAFPVARGQKATARCHTYNPNSQPAAGEDRAV